jgi:hypothetical protein
MVIAVFMKKLIIAVFMKKLIYLIPLFCYIFYYTQIFS